MTNAKSRLVRIIALALAVLMIVPMALVGCKKTEAGVDQAALDAALKEALDAAQKAQDAADKAAQDAKDAQDKLAEAEKEAEKLQDQIDDMKNTTAAPATTTQAPKEDATVIDPYITVTFNDAQSEYRKTRWYYNQLKANNAYYKPDADAIDELFAVAEVAITRAPSTDYVNQIVAKLKADLDAVPTFSERVKEAYDAIDFASNEDVIDVVFAANLADKAARLLDGKDAITISAPVGDEYEGYDELADAVEAVLAAEVKALVAEELNLLALINQEYYRYTGKRDKVYNADAAKTLEDILYEDVYNYAKYDIAYMDIADDIAAIFGTTVPGELVAENIVWGPAPYGTYGDNKDAAKEIAQLYADFYLEYKNEGYANLKEAFEIAFIGEDYILIEDGNYLVEKLEEAKNRILELEAAAKEYQKNTFSGKLEQVVADYTADGLDYLYTEKKNTDKVAELLATWMDKYDFKKDNLNIDAIIGRANFNTFADAKAYVDGVNKWVAKAEAIGADVIEDLLDEYVDEGKFSYTKYGSAALALETMLRGSWNKKTGTFINDGILVVDDIKLPSGTAVSVSVANLELILDEVFDIAAADVANLNAALDYFRINTVNLMDQVKEAGEINKDVKKIVIEGLKLGSDDYKKGQKAKAAIWNFFLAIGADIEEYNKPYDKTSTIDATNVLEAVAEWDLDSINADLIDWAKFADVVEAMKGASSENVVNASEIVKFYLATAKTILDAGIKNVDLNSVSIEEDDTIKFKRNELQNNGSTKEITYVFDIAPAVVVLRDYSKIKALADIKAAMDVAATKGIKDPVYVADIDGVEVEFSFTDAIKMYNDIAQYYYKKLMEPAHTVAYSKIRNHAVTDGYQAATNDWRSNFSGDPTAIALYAKFDSISTILGEYAPEFRFVGATDIDDRDNDGDTTDKLDMSYTKDGSVINLFNTEYVYKSGDKTYTYINAVLSVDYTKYVTKSSDGIIIAFDKQEYYNAINSAVASYYKTWLQNYIYNRPNHANYNNKTYLDGTVDYGHKSIIIAQDLVNYAINYGFWTIEETIEVEGSSYKFVIASIGTSAVLKVYDEEGVEVDYIRAKRAGETVYYKLSFQTNVAYDPASAYEDADFLNFGTTMLDKANVKIFVEEYKKLGVNNYVATADPKAPTTLAGLLEVEESAYIYELVDHAEEIKANLKTVPTNVKYYDNPSSTYVIVTGAWVDSVIAAYQAREYYEGATCYFNAMTTAYNALTTKPAAVTAMYKNYAEIFNLKDGKLAKFGGATTVEQAIAAYNALVTEIQLYK